MLVNHSQLATIVNCSKSMIYQSIDTKKKEIDIDKFIDLCNHSHFIFVGKNFSDRLKIDFKKFAYIEAKTVIELLGIDYYELKKLRDNNLVEYRKITQTQTLYKVSSLIENFPSATLKVPYIQKQFYTLKEAQHLLLNQGCSISLRTLYRYLENDKIPFIKIGTAYRIPIIEFNIIAPTFHTNVKR